MRIHFNLVIKKVIFSFIAIFLVAGAIAGAALAEDSTIKIGVLTKRGPERYMEEWSPTAEYLTENIPGKTFTIVPIAYDQIYTVVKNGEVDFILANSSFYVELENYYGISRIATLKNKVSGEISTTYGGVIFCKKQRNDIRQFRDLKGKTFMAVEETSFGGWRMAWRELKEAGIDPFKDFASFSFGGTHDAVVYAVRDGKVDAGTVRTDTLERMNAEGKIRLDDFYVIHEHGGGNVHLPFLHSTREYPEWPIAKLQHASIEVAEKVAIALISMRQDAAAAQAARCAGWTIPLNYQSVHDCLKELKVGPYKDLGKITLTDIFRKYWILILIDLATLVVLAWFLGARIKLSRKLKTAHVELQSEVDERILTGELLQKERDRVLAYLDIAAVIIVILNRDQSIAVINKKGCEILGYDESEIIGKNWFESFLPKRDRDQTRVVFSELMAGDIEPVKYYENYVLTKDNKERLIAWNNSVLRDDKGEIIATLASGEDITERKQTEEALKKSEKQFSDLFNSITDLIYTQDMEGRFISANPAMQKLFGYNVDEFVGHRATDFMEPELQSGFNARYLEVIKKQGHHEGVACYFKKNKEKIYIEYRSSLVKPDDGEPYISGIGRDVTERVLSEEKVEKLQKRVIQAQKMESIGTLAGGIAHDFNNLLFAVMGNISLAEYDLKPEIGTSESLKEAQKACIKAKELTARLITFSKGGDPVKKMMSVKNLLKDTVISALSGSDIKPEIFISDDIRQVNIDEGQIKQAVRNIVVNAKEAMDDNGQLTVSCETVDIAEEGYLTLNQGEYIKISFKDHGCGISKENLEKIFDPYFSTKDMGADKGQGLGLTVSYSIIKKHGGLINVESEPGTGSTFSVYLLALSAKEPDLQKSEGKPTAQKPVKLPATGTGKILLMDDEEAIRTLLGRVLNRLGYDVETCIEGKEAIELYKKAMESKEPFDMVILDLTNKIGMGGQETMRRLLEIDSDVKGIVITGYSDDPVVANFRAYGFSGFITKPTTMDELSKVINEVVSRGQ